jgi:hypothetical protein
MDQAAQEVFQQEVKQHLVQIFNARGLFSLGPAISLIGQIPANTMVQEFSLQQVDVQILPPMGANTHACLSLGFFLSGSAVTSSNMSGFIQSDDYAVLLSGKIMEAIVVFRWRIGQYPAQLLSSPGKQVYQENGNTIPILIYARAVQRDVLNTAGLVLANIRPAGTYLYGIATGTFTYLMANTAAQESKAYAEDHLLLGGHAGFETLQVLRADNHQPAPAEVQQAWATPPAFQNVMLEWPLSLSFVGTPPALPVPEQEQHVQALRQSVTTHFSRPFASPLAITLTLRQANGLENLLLSRGKVTL